MNSTGIYYLDINIIKQLDISSFVNLAQSNHNFLKYFSDEQVWQEWIQFNFGNEKLVNKPKNLTFKNYAFILDKISYTVEFANQAAQNGDCDILNMLSISKIYPNEIGANLAVLNFHWNIMDWLIKKQIYPNVDVANQLAEMRCIDGLNKLAVHEIFPDPNNLNSCVYQNLKLVMWLADYKLLPNWNTIDNCAKSGNLNGIKMCKNMGWQVSAWGVNMAAINGHLNILQYLAKNGIYPDQNGIKLTIQANQKKIMYWFSRINLQPSKPDYSNIFSKSKIKLTPLPRNLNIIF